ncbi:HPP family protein [Kitasatospora sp. NBC_00240]|uniref:HPP family protein n=1 Tax=Kitasatospora sp. NBC_00240 TaxID=2903567 RepID=UPI00224DA394|nr:HPP family protein [Kitasatospora sp. NBC_00240]MCX5209884.1 HPP family protein [Kitasatospora sp. NBC_00240]
MSTDQAARPRPALRPPVSRAPASPSLGTMLHATTSSISVLLLIVAAGALLHQPMLIPPLAASAALVHSTPALPLAQPRSLVGGHLLAALTGFAVLAVLGSATWAAALAGGLALAVMMFSRTQHTPAVATAVIVVLQAPRPARFLPLLLAATVLIVLAAMAATRAKRGGPAYPSYWW